ncbi:MAG: hypothetical protein KF729_25575 [Sandaracinaceae bacterium]|nr:hypothetical protein [Sandaracinaceae bacterium]
MGEEPLERPRTWGTTLSLIAVGLSFVTPLVGLVLLFSRVPWLGAIVALTAPVLGIGAIVLASRSRRAAKRAGRRQWPAVLAIALAALMVVPSSALGSAVALVDGVAAVLPRSEYVGYASREPEWGWSDGGSACGSWTCARVPSGRELVGVAVVIGALAGLSALGE